MTVEEPKRKSKRDKRKNSKKKKKKENTIANYTKRLEINVIAIKKRTKKNRSQGYMDIWIYWGERIKRRRMINTYKYT